MKGAHSRTTIHTARQEEGRCPLRPAATASEKPRHLQLSFFSDELLLETTFPSFLLSSVEGGFPLCSQPAHGSLQCAVSLFQNIFNCCSLSPKLCCLLLRFDSRQIIYFSKILFICLSFWGAWGRGRMKERLSNRLSTEPGPWQGARSHHPKTMTQANTKSQTLK